MGSTVSSWAPGSVFGSVVFSKNKGQTDSDRGTSHERPMTQIYYTLTTRCFHMNTSALTKQILCLNQGHLMYSVVLERL